MIVIEKEQTEAKENKKIVAAEEIVARK